MFGDTITVFNFKGGYYYPHVLHGVDAVGISDGATATNMSGTTNSDIGTVLIQTNASKIIAADNTVLPYVSPKAFEALTDGIDSVITFQPQKDFILVGAYESTQPIYDDDYETGFYDELNSTRDGVYQISSAVFYSLIPHFEIGVK
jgi:hypothetical protein